MNKIACIITNYNMPERTDALAEFILKKYKKIVDLIVVDNASDLVPPSQYTTLFLKENIQSTGGWLRGLEEAKKLNPFAYWFIITSAEFIGKDCLNPMIKLLENNPNAVGVHPALSLDSSTPWKHLFTRGKPSRKTWYIDNISSLWRADWFDSVGGFDPDLKYAWGIDFDICWKARSQGKEIWITEPAGMKKLTNIGYAMKRMNMTMEMRSFLAGQNMTCVLAGKYGPFWHDKLTLEFVTHDLL